MHSDPIPPICCEKPLRKDLNQSSSHWLAAVAIFLAILSPANAYSADDLPQAVRERFSKYCFDCHANGSAEGGFDFEKLATGQYGEDTRAKWETVWKNLRAQTIVSTSGLISFPV